MPKKPIPEPPDDTRAIRDELEKLLNSKDATGRRVGNATRGIYAFYDYDAEPIYVGQTRESLRTRIRRHLTNQRTDAVAMNVLDPFEVAEVEMWPFWTLMTEKGQLVKDILNSAEYTVFEKLLRESTFNAVLNEGTVAPASIVELPPSIKGKIVPDSVYSRRKHPDERIARRCETGSGHK